MFGSFGSVNELYWVTPCPKCGSKKVGLYEQKAKMSPFSRTAYVIQHGKEPPPDILHKTFYALQCADCKHSYPHDHETALKAVIQWDMRYLTGKVLKISFALICVGIVYYLLLRRIK